MEKNFKLKIKEIQTGFVLRPILKRDTLILELDALVPEHEANRLAAALAIEIDELVVDHL